MNFILFFKKDICNGKQVIQKIKLNIDQIVGEFYDLTLIMASWLLVIRKYYNIRTWLFSNVCGVRK